MGANEIEPVAFLSYAHSDDESAVRELSVFHDRLQSELRIYTGLPVHIFFDKKNIGWGKRWAEFIKKGLESTAFLIPILTPAFFQSQACRDEYMKFAETERRLGRRDLILPVYYVRSFEIERGSKDDKMVKDILTRQYRDWRRFRHRQRDDWEMLQHFSDLASSITETFFELKETVALDLTRRSEKIDRGSEAVAYIEEVLNREINYESIVAYSVEIWPRLPVSQDLTRTIIAEINRDRYNLVRDIDREVKYAAEKIKEYASEQPEKFRYSSDFISKSLIFVDSEYRGKASMSSRTRNAAVRANITRY